MLRIALRYSREHCELFIRSIMSFEVVTIDMSFGTASKLYRSHWKTGVLR